MVKKYDKQDQQGKAAFNETFTDPKMKAGILNKQFKSVFARPQPLSLNQSCKQLLTPQNHPKMTNVNITEEGV
jgi:hypothetical protein